MTEDGSDARLDELRAENELLRLSEHRLRLELEAARLDNERSLNELREAHEMYGRAFASRSWRWTKPLRRERRAGQVAKSTAGAPSDSSREAAASAGSPRIAVVVHLFYPELWELLRAQLGNLQEPFDLFVSLTEGHSDEAAGIVHQHFPEAVVRVHPNRGRDIAPFVELIRSGALDEYDAILKLHTKRSNHRADGDEWRTALWHGLLPDPQSARHFATLVSGHPDVGAILPAGSVHTADSIGSNGPRLTELLARVGLDWVPEELRFPAGSMYWIDGSVVELLKAIFFGGAEEFEPELGQADGTTAHAFERLIGVVLARRGQQLIHAEDAPSVPATPLAETKRPRVFAFYLPQYHRTAENDEWWGDGFTDWVSVAGARSWHPDQRFPRAPVAPLGRYDLACGDVPAQQFELASRYGVDGFLVYHYWFSGRRLLQAPMERVLAHPEWSFPYALVWANENWTRKWDGLDDHVLIAQEYAPGWASGLFDSLVPYLRDPRYLRLGGKPLLVIYKPSEIPELSTALTTLRALARQEGLGALHIAGVLHDREVSNAEGVADAPLDSWIEFPPLSGPTPSGPQNTFSTDEAQRGVAHYKDLMDRHHAYNVFTTDGTLRGVIHDYKQLVDQLHFLPALGGRFVHPGAMPSWDNTPRRAVAASSFVNANPADFRRWLVALRKNLAATSSPHESVVCINAWNEWAETAHLEPDDRVGRANLEAIRSAFGRAPRHTGQ